MEHRLDVTDRLYFSRDLRSPTLVWDLPPLVDKSGYTDEYTMFDNLYAVFQQHAPITLHPNPEYL